MEPVIWVVGRTTTPTWQILGVFEKEEDAVNRCTQPNDFVGPVVINAPLLEDEEIWPGAYYPNLVDG